MSGINEIIYEVFTKDDRWKFYVEGLKNTLKIAGLACLIGIVLGLVVAVVKVYSKNSRSPALKILNAIFYLYTTIIRGTPIVVQLLILFSLSAIPDNLTACIIGFGLNSGAYVSEIFRAGINSVNDGQMEAGRSLGLGRTQTMIRIIIPQAIKNALPTLFNEFIVLIKETSVAGYIGVMDLTKAADSLRGRTFDNTHLYVVAIAYLLLTFLLTLVQRSIERRFSKSDRS